MQHPIHATPVAQPGQLPFIVAMMMISVLVLPPALWFGPVALDYVIASAVIGVVFALLILLAQRYRTSHWGHALRLGGLSIVIGGSLVARTTMLSPSWQHFAPWSTFIQSMAVLLLSCMIIFAARTRILPRWGAALLLWVLLAISALVWYRADQSQPLVYPAARQVIMDDDAPPGVRVVQFTTTAPTSTVLTFYREQLEARGWQYTCSTDQPPCASNLTDWSAGIRAVYHRQTDRARRGPTYEILLRPTETDTTLVTVYDQTRGLPLQPVWP